MKESNRYLGEEKIELLMRKFSVPCIMSLLVASLYNIVDQIFVGQGVGYLGNGATNVVFPITIVALAFALMIGDGCAAYLSICQGKKDVEGAKNAVGNAVVFIILVSIVYTILLILFRDTLLKAFGATENNIAYAVEYYNVLVWGVPFYMLGNSLNSVIRADGNPKFAMISTLTGAVINLILDPIAIFGLGLGMTGAAAATIIGQIVTAALSIAYITRPISFRLDKNSFLLKGKLMGKFLPLGVSSFLTQISIVVIMAAMNNMLVIYGAQSKYGADIPLTVVGIVMKVFQIVIAFVVGIAAGCQPIIGYNYGAGFNGRVRQIYKKMILAEGVIGILAMFAFECFPMQIIGIFGSESQLYNEFAVLSFRIYLCTILLCCIQKSTSIFLQALGKPVLSMGLSLLRDFVFSVVFILVFPRFFGLVGVLYSAPVADILSIMVVFVMMKKVLGQLKEKEKANEMEEECRRDLSSALGFE